MLESKAVLLMKKEGTYGVDAAPIATDAVPSGPVTWAFKDGSVQRKVVLPYFGELAKIPLGVGIDISFSIEIFGSGTKDVSPVLFGLMIQALGWGETVNAGVSVVWDETTTQDVTGLTLYWYNDGIRYKATGCVVESMKLDFSANKEATVAVKLSGLYGGVADITDTALITPTFGTLQVPPVFQGASLTIDAYAAVISKCEIDITNTVAARPDPNAASGVTRYSITARSIKGSIDPEQVALATWNPFSLWSAGTTGALSFTLGATSGNKYTLSLPAIARELPKLAARSGIRTYQLAFESVPTLSAGNNRLTITHL